MPVAPIDYATPVGKVRLLIADTNPSALILETDQVEGYLVMNGAGKTVATLSQVRRAAADAMDAIATSEALVGKVMRTADGTTTDGAKLADSLRKQAATLRGLADTADAVEAEDADGGYVSVTEFHPYPRGW